ncbi:hypothetical protein [Desertibaculum subflavum]|uniref:hypothetical protein n=1 Tax=Desertibaculum subflavum TaxID=2268458 RepID=UPI0013C3E7AF
MSSAAGAAVLDQNNWPATANFFGSNWQQEVRSGIAGQLTRIEISILGEPNGLSFSLNRGQAWQADANDVELSNLAPVGGVLTIDLTAANIQLDIGDYFVFSVFVPPPAPIEPPPGGICACVIILPSPPSLGATDDIYDDGELYVAGLPFSDLDIAFRTYVEPASTTDPVTVGEPAGLLPLAAGLAALAAFRRRKAG